MAYVLANDGEDVEQMDGQTDTDRRTDGWMEEWVDKIQTIV